MITISGHAGELVTLSSLGIVSISLAATALTNTFNSGNWVSHTSTFRLTSGEIREIQDIWFWLDGADTIRTDTITLDPRTLFLPTIGGTGTLRDLHAAMSLDPTLFEMVQAFTLSASPNVFAQKATTDARIEAILLRWAGAEGVDPASRGSWDAQKLVVLEKMLGNPYFNTAANTSNVPFNATAGLDVAWARAVEAIKSLLLLQTPGIQSLFDKAPFYNLLTGGFSGEVTLDLAAIADLGVQAKASGNAAQFWLEFAKVLGPAKPFEDLSTVELDALRAVVSSSGAGLTWESILGTLNAEQLLFQPTPHGDGFTGSYRNEGVTGGTGSDYFDGGAGHDRLAGSAGHDTLIGGGGNDSLVGGEGDDRLTGSSGNDTLDGGNGHDTIEAGPGTDIVIDSEGNDVHTLGEGDDQFTNIPPGPFTGQLNGGGNDIVNGDGGDDSIRSNQGDDTLVGGDGNDTITDFSGRNTFIGGAGNDTITGWDESNTYIYTSGHDRYQELDVRRVHTPDSDIIVLPDTVKRSDVSFSRNFVTQTQQYDLTIMIKNHGSITIVDQFSGSPGTPIEQIRFADGTTIDLLTIRYTTKGTELSDRIVVGIRGGGSIDDNIQTLGGADTAYSGDGNDTINGGSGNDFLRGDSGNDRIDGGTENDALEGGIGADTLNGGDGNDSLTAEGVGDTDNSRDKLDGGAGNDTLQGYGGNDSLKGGTGDDRLYDTLGKNTLDGGDGNDVIVAGTGNDLLTGGIGTDTLQGATGNDTYAFTLGDGVDTIRDNGGSTGDVIRFGAGITFSSLTFQRSGADLVIRYSATDRITVTNHFHDLQYGVDAGQKIESIRFADGTSLSLLGTLPFRPATVTALPIDSQTLLGIKRPVEVTDQDSPFNFALADRSEDESASGAIFERLFEDYSDDPFSEVLSYYKNSADRFERDLETIDGAGIDDVAWMMRSLESLRHGGWHYMTP